MVLGESVSACDKLGELAPCQDTLVGKEGTAIPVLCHNGLDDTFVNTKFDCRRPCDASTPDT